MKLLLVMPTAMQVGYEDFFSVSPLGIETLAAHARQHVDVAIVDMRGRGLCVDTHAEQLLADGPDMIGISVNSAPHTVYSLALAREIRRRDPRVTILVGGQQATFLAEEVLSPGHVDAVVRGEGEHTLCEILTRGDFRGVAGVSWLDGHAVRNEADRAQIEDIDTVLSPARDLLPDRSRYRMGRYRIEGIESSRGCPFACSFCSVRNFHLGQWRPKSPQRVLQEIDEILERYPEEKVIYFADDNFSHDIRRVEEICRGIVERDTPTHFWCQGRVDTLSRNPDVVEWMGKARFSAVLLGLETPNPRQLKESRKGITVEQMERTVDLLHANDVGVWGTFVLGLPGETREEAQATAKFIRRTKTDVVQITIATPIPGSDLYARAKADDQLLTRDWDRYDFISPIMKGQLPKEQLDAILYGAYLRTYLKWRFLRSLFSRRTNLFRLRRTALRAFASTIWSAVRQEVKASFRRRLAAPALPSCRE